MFDKLKEKAGKKLMNMYKTAASKKGDGLVKRVAIDALGMYDRERTDKQREAKGDSPLKK